MEFGLFNITTATTTTLIAKGQKAGSIKSIRFTNIHDTDPVKLDLFLDDDTNKTYFFKNDVLLPGESMFLDKGVSFNNSAIGLKLKTTAFSGSTTGVSINVIIK